MNPLFRHFLLTRFSVAVLGSRFRERAWLDKRFELFEQFCFPSVEGQTTHAFEWLVFFDASLPQDLRERVVGYSRFSCFWPVYVEGGFGCGEIHEALRLVGLPSEYTITTRLDNDDALAVNFIETIQGQFQEQDFEFLNFPDGCIWDGMLARSFRDCSSPFLSLIERTGRLQTVLGFDHTKASAAGRIRQVDHKLAWMVVVHGGNVINRARGKRIPTDDWKSHFAIPALSIKR